MESLAEPSSVVPKINCPKRPGTPDLQCTICLGDIINTCNSDSCWHTFCFECLKHWSHIQPSCPLCKNIFKNIYHSFTSHGSHETYIVPTQEVVDHDTVVFGMNMDAFQRNNGLMMNDLQIQNFNDNNITPGLVYNNIVGNHHNYGRTFQMIPSFDNYGPIHDQVIGQITRTLVYNEDLWAQPLPDINGRFRDFSSAFFRDNPNQTNRLHNFILRDILAIRALVRFTGFLTSTHELTITSMILYIISIHERRGASISDMVRPYLGMYTELFCHELLNYANSPFIDLIGYDSNVNYIRREDLLPQMSTAGVNIPVIFPTLPEDLRISQGETIIILDTDDEEIDTVTSQVSSDNSHIEIVNQPFDVFVNVVGKYNLSRGRLFPSTLNGSSSYPANLSRMKCPTHLRRKIVMDSSSSDEEF